MRPEYLHKRRADGERLISTRATLNVTYYNQHTVTITSAGRGLGRDIALGLGPTNYRVFSAAVSSDVSLDFNHASGDAITEPI